MKIIKTSLDKPDKRIINQAVKVLEQGGIIIYPTDTAYGLGGNALDENVIKKVYEIKKRGRNKPTHVIVRDWKMIEKITYTNAELKKLYVKLLPGPLTIILTKKKLIPNMLTAGLNTLGVRIPNCKVTEMISESLDFPYTTPSANRSGGLTPYSIDDVKNELDLNKIDLVIDAGILPRSEPSTIIDLTLKPYKILREGPISKNQIDKILFT